MRVGAIRRKSAANLLGSSRQREVQPTATHGRHLSSAAARTEPRNAPV